MDHPINHHSGDVSKLPTLSILNVLRCAQIGHRDAAEDAIRFNDKMLQCVNELMTRAERDGLVAADPTELRRLRDELAAARERAERAENAEAELTGEKPKHKKQTKPPAKPPHPTKEIQAFIRERLAGGVGYGDIADALNHAGYTTRRGNAWTYQSVYGLASYMGVQRA